jgi:peptidoglycan hydrolase CwlO-like protein
MLIASSRLDPTLLVFLASSATVFIGSVVQYAVGRRKNSGDIETSTADALWQESQSIRIELARQVTASANQVADLTRQVAGLVAELENMKMERVSEQQQIVVLRARVKLLEDTIKKAGLEVP